MCHHAANLASYCGSCRACNSPLVAGESGHLLEPAFKPGEMGRVNLSRMQGQGVVFHAALTDAGGNIVKQTSGKPPKFLVKLLVSFKGVNTVEVTAEPG